MRSLLKLLIAAIGLLFFSENLKAQTCLNTGLNGTVINLPCNENCINVPVRIPHLKSTTDYTVNDIPYSPFPYQAGNGVELTSLYIDDEFSPLINLPFSFCFYDSTYTKVVIGSNGVLTFDEICANQSNAYTLTTGGNPQTIPYNGGTAPGGIGTTYYPRASIMGAYHDINPSLTAGGERRIEYSLVGTAPCRKLVVSYFSVPMFGTGCNTLICTQQIVLYESTGVVEVFFENKPVCPDWPSGAGAGLAILGIQNWDRNQAVAAPGKNATVWTASNEGYRFTPSGGGSRFLSCEVYELGGTTPLAVGDTVTTTPGLLDVTFPSFCPAGTGNQYVIKTVFSACDNAANQIVSFDTITINKTANLDATAAVTPTSCGVTGTGTATITVPTGVGVPPYTMVLNPGNITQVVAGNTHTFNGLVAGNYTVTVTDGGTSGCQSDVPVTITSTGALALTFNTTNTSCVGAANGSITVNPPNATPPVLYSINGGPFSPNNVFNNLLPGTYQISASDAAGCQAVNVPVTITTGPSITLTFVSNPTSCVGANNGSVVITPTGTAPFQYAINAGPYQSSNTFTNLPPGTHFFDVRDAVGCTISFYPITVTAGTGTLTGTAVATATTCPGVNNGAITVTPTSGSGPYQYSLNGGTYQSSNIFGGLAPGSYTIVIQENGLCTSGGIPVTVTAGTALQGTVATTATSCNGATDGTITATPTNGSAPYQYQLDGGAPQAGNVFNNVAAGNHTIIITDASGCVSAAIPANITAGPALTGTATSTTTTCTGVNNGTITVTASNGTGPFTYALDGGTPQSSNVFTGVSAGSHNVVISNGSCTSANIPVTVGTGGGFTATHTATATSCAGADNGSITITTGAGGTSPYTFVLNGTVTQNGATGTTFNGVAAGAHVVLITDANGCQFTINNISVAVGAGLTANLVTTPTTCTGVNNGSITVTPTNGTGPYEFVLDGTTTQNGATSTTFNNLSAGSHSITITDAIGCITTTALTISVNTGSGFTATHTSAPTTCAGAANGSITVTPGAGGTGPYTFVLNGTTTQTGPTSTTFNGLADGTYTILITDANGCQYTLSNATVTAGAQLTATTTPTSTACPGVDNGSILVTPTNGNGPYTFVLNGTTTQTGATSTTFTGVAAGSHTIGVTDANGCTSTLPVVNVGTGTGIQATVTPTGTSCSGAANGSILITPTNGTAPFTFVLNGTTTQSGATSTTFAGLAAGGTYSIVVTDAIGCTGTFSNINVTQGSVLTATAVAQATSCGGATNGQVTVTPTNGAGPYTFVLDGTTTQTGAASTTFINLSSGAHSVIVTDAAGCVSNAINVTVDAGPSIAVTLAKTDATCFGSSTGSVTATPSANATPAIEYSLDNATWQSSPTFASLAAGSYTVYIRDNAGCSNSSTIVIGEPAQLIATGNVQNVSCNGQSDGVITITATGGTGAKSYSLNNGPVQSSNVFNVPAGTYSVEVIDANNCSVIVSNITVTEPAALGGTSVTTNASCDGGPDGTITVTATGGTAPFEYSVDGGNFQSSNVLNVIAGTYSNITIRDAKGCTFVLNPVVVGLNNNLTLTPAVDPAPICEGSSVTLQLNTNATSFIWSAANPGLSGYATASPVASPTSTTLYTVTVTLGECTATDDVLVTVLPAPIANAGPEGDICFGQNYQLQGSGGVEYAWSPSTYLDDPAVANPQVTNPSETIVYSLSVKDANGCSSLAPAEVTVYVTPPIQVTTYPTDTVVHAGAQFQMLAISAGETYSWSPAVGLDNANIPNPVATAPGSEGAVVNYIVTTTTSAGCSGEATVTIRVYKGPDIYMVNAFTPNADGKNDRFIPIPVGIKHLNYFRVFNRWGQVVYSTKTLNEGWDGRLGGVEQPSGAYVWMVEGVTFDNKVITKKGTVLIIR